MHRAALKRVSMGLATFAIAILILWAVRSLTEASYNGRPLSWWLEKHYRAIVEGPPNHNSVQLSAQAIRSFGSNALPTLRRMMTAQDSRLKEAVIKLAQKQRLFRVKLTTADQYHVSAALAYQVLGPAAAPDLLDFMRALTNSRPTVRRCAAVALASIGSDAQPAVEALVIATKDPDRDVKLNAIAALQSIHVDSDAVIDALIASLQDPFILSRENSARALAACGPKASKAIPALLQALTNTPAAANALKILHGSSNKADNTEPK